MAGPLKGTEGLSDLAKQLLELAGHELSKQTQRQLYAQRPPATPQEVEGYLVKIMKEHQAGTAARARAEAQRLKALEYWNKVNPEVP